MTTGVLRLSTISGRIWSKYLCKHTYLLLYCVYICAPQPHSTPVKGPNRDCGHPTYSRLQVCWEFCLDYTSDIKCQDNRGVPEPILTLQTRAGGYVIQLLLRWRGNSKLVSSRLVNNHIKTIAHTVIKGGWWFQRWHILGPSPAPPNYICSCVYSFLLFQMLY